MTRFSTLADAETLAVRAAGWVASTDDLLSVFLGSSGFTPDNLRAGLDDPDFLAAVLDFVMQDDAWVLAFCEDEGIAPSTVAAARATLPGGNLPSWT